MSYQIKKCPSCGKYVHVHNRNNRRFIKNACEHIPYGFATKRQVYEFFKGEGNHEQRY